MGKASDEKCCKCGKQAVAYWPVFDPDIPANEVARLLEEQKNKVTNEACFMYKEEDA